MGLTHENNIYEIHMEIHMGIKYGFILIFKILKLNINLLALNLEFNAFYEAMMLYCENKDS